MSDETTLLQSLSKLKNAGRLRYWRGVIEMPETELHAICDEIQAEHDQAIAATLGRPKAKAHPYGYEPDTGAFDCTRCECGCINDISAKYCNDCGGEIEIDMYAEKEIYHCPRHLVFAEKHDDGSLEFDGKRYIAATLGSGMLTADDVLNAVYKHGARWQAIADELNAKLGSEVANADDALSLLDEIREAGRISYDDYSQLFDAIAELGSGTCNPIETEALENVTAHVMECDRCGKVYEHVNGAYEHCPRCGRRVER